MARTPFACADDRGPDDRGPDDRGAAARGPGGRGTGDPESADPEPVDPEPEPEPEPAEPTPAGRLCVPVRPGAHGVTARLFRTPVGARTAVAFTTPERLRATLGAGQSWIPLSEPALRALARPLGVHALTVDPVLTAPFTPGPASEAVPDSVPPSPPDPAAVPLAARPGTPCARRFDARGSVA